MNGGLSDSDINIMLIIGLAVILFSLIFIVVSFLVRSGDKKKREMCSVITQGEVISYFSESHHYTNEPKRRQLVTPVFRYYVNGMEVRSHSNLYMRPCPYQIGSVATIMYNPANPRQMMLDNSSSAKTVSIIFLGVGIIFTLVGIGLVALSLFF